jgi:hypothetical protein
LSTHTNKDVGKVRKLKKDAGEVLGLRERLSRAARTFSGEDLAVAVLAWFRDPDCGPEDDVRQLWDRACRPWAYLDDDTAEWIESSEVEWKMHFVRTYGRTPEGPKLGLQGAAPSMPAPAGKHAKKLLAWNDAVLLWERGLLNRVRVCGRPSCGEYFFARFRHTQYHDLACRKAVETSDPEYLRKQREHMQKIRQQKGKKP